MTIEQAFLKDIVEHPDDDGPRLVYADWCDDHGDPDRAAFVRAQCRLHAMGRFDPERYDLEAAELDLLAKHEKKWKKPLAKITARCELARGFIEKVALPEAKFIAVWEDLFARAPVRALRVLRLGQDWGKLMKCQGLARLRTLDLAYNRPGMARAQALAKSANVAHLHELNLTSGKITNRGLQAIAASPGLANLRSLILHANQLTDVAIDHLTDSPHLKNLTRLDLTSNALSPAGFARLARWEQAGRIEELSVGGDSRGQEEAAWYENLFDGEWPALRKLTVNRARLSERALQRLAGRNFAGLRELELFVWDWDTMGARTIFRSPHLTRLEALDLSQGTPQPDEAVRELASSPMTGSLRSLKLAVSTDTLALLAKKGALRGLHELMVAGEDTGIGQVIAATDLPELRRLSLRHTHLSDASLIALLASPVAGRLRELHLPAVEMKRAGLQALIDSPTLSSLYRLWLPDAPFFLSPEELERLRERFGVALVA